MGIILLTGLYVDADAGRRGEFLECLRRNIGNERLDEIHVFGEEPGGDERLATAYPLLADSKVRLVAHGRRVTYCDLFAYANSRLAGRRVMIANADIFADHTLGLLDSCDLTGKLLCLSRWDVQPDGSAYHFDHPSSQDAWIFESPIRDFWCDFHLGVPGCDNRLAWEAEQSGLVLSNPSRSLRVCHLHHSQVRHYSERQRLEGPTRAVPAAALATDEPALNAAPDGASLSRGSIFALTSLSPSPEHATVTRQCLASWRNAGLQVRAFNHPDEIPELSRIYDVEFVPVANTTEAVFGRPLIPINAMLDWAGAQDVVALVINSDIDLRMTDWELKRLRWLCDGGLCFFVRHNHDGDERLAEREAHGIDAFLLHGQEAALFPDSWMSMGQPFWDYWVPHVFAANRRPIYSVEFPVAFHRTHHFRWSWEHWQHCALEFARVTGASAGNGSFEACRELSIRVRQNFDRQMISVPRSPINIREWVERTFQYPGMKLFLELGAHHGEDTAWLAEIPAVSIHAFEPDPRNHQPARPNVTLHRAAVADRDDWGSLILSQQGWGQEWTYSSSIKQPKNHLQRYPVTFGEAIEVKLIRLDTFHQDHQLGVIDFIWADIQGAEGEMIRGGRHALERTRYLFTEYSDDELYDNQATLKEILEMLPDFRVVELWPDDVLLENTKLRSKAFSPGEA